MVRFFIYLIYLILQTQILFYNAVIQYYTKSMEQDWQEYHRLNYQLASFEVLERNYLADSSTVRVPN